LNELRLTAVAIDSLTNDPANARKHDEINIEAIKASLKLFGQRKPLVVTADNIVLAGNGTLEAAKRLGWDKVTITRTPADWSYEQCRAFALADNRSAELAVWEDERLKNQLLELDAEGWELVDLGFPSLEPPSPSSFLNGLDNNENTPLNNLNVESSEIYGIPYAFSPEQRQVIFDAVNVAKKRDDMADGPTALVHICQLYLGDTNNDTI
jgi:hypothetical protein